MKNALQRLCVWTMGVLLAGSSAWAGELVKNGNFEEGLKDWTWMIYGGAKATCRVEPVAGGEGKKALRLSSSSEFKGGVAGVLHQIVHGLTPKTTYTLSARFKGKQIGQVWIGGGKGWDIRGYLWLGDVDEWQTAAVTFTTGADETSFEVMIAADGRTEAAWIDQVKLVSAASERVDQAQARLQKAIDDGQRQLAAGPAKARLSEPLKANLETAQKELLRLTSRKAELEKTKALMSNDEQTQWADKLLTLQSQVDGVVVWTGEAMEDLKPTTMPQTFSNLETIKWRACRNEHAPVVVNITNLVEAPALDVRAVLTAFVPAGQPSVPHRLGDWCPDEIGAYRAYKGSAGEIPASQIVLREAVPIRKASGDWTCDPLAKLDQAGRIVVPVGQTRQLWIDPATFDIAPGMYQANLILTPTDPLGDQVTRTVRLELEVLPVALPKRAPISVFNFEYGLSANPNCLADLVEAGVNVLDVCIRCDIPARPTPASFKFLDGYIASAKKYNAMLMIENNNVQRTGWKPEYEPWFRTMFAYLRDQGLRDDQFFMHIYDEQLSPELMAAAKAIKAIDPKVMIIADPYQNHYDEKTCESFLSYIDIWCPKLGLLETWAADRPKFLEKIRAQNKRLWFYDCNSGKCAESAMSNRTFGWAAFKYNTQGCTAWTYSTTDYSDPWGANHSWEKIYPLADGSTVPSRRWEAWREGLEDYCLLAVLRQMIEAKANKQVSPAEYLKAKKTVNEAVAAVMAATQNAQILTKQRVRLLEVARVLSEAKK